MTHNTILNKLKNYIHWDSKLHEIHKQLVIDVMKPAFFVSCKKSEARNIDFDKSKIGGTPIANEEISSFLETNKDYTQIFQLNFKDIAEYADALDVPSKGVLFVFLKSITKENLSYFDPSQFKCFYSTEYSGMQNNYSPKWNLEPSEFSFKKIISIPDDEAPFWEQMQDEYDDFNFDIYEAIDDKIREVCNKEVYHTSQIAGYDSAVQSSAMYDFAAKDLIDLPTNTEAFYIKYREKWDEIKSLSSEYKLLCQIDSDMSNASIREYLDGVIYIGIRKDELKKNDLSKLRLVFQNT